MKFLLTNFKDGSKDGLPETYLKMYYDHQWDWVKKLHDQRLQVSGFVFTLNVLAFTLGLDNQDSLNLVTGLVTPGIMVCANLVAILFVVHTKRLAKKRLLCARGILETYLPGLNEFDKQFRSEGYFGLEKVLYTLHSILIVSCILLAVGYFIGIDL